VRVEEDERLAAAHHELVDGVERLLGRVLRVDQEEDADVVVELLDVAG
jgi:hypothetical protein